MIPASLMVIVANPAFQEDSAGRAGNVIGDYPIL